MVTNIFRVSFSEGASFVSIFFFREENKQINKLYSLKQSRQLCLMWSIWLNKLKAMKAPLMYNPDNTLSLATSVLILDQILCGTREKHPHKMYILFPFLCVCFPLFCEELMWIWGVQQTKISCFFLCLPNSVWKITIRTGASWPACFFILSGTFLREKKIQIEKGSLQWDAIWSAMRKVSNIYPSCYPRFCHAWNASNNKEFICLLTICSFKMQLLFREVTLYITQNDEATLNKNSSKSRILTEWTTLIFITVFK